MARNCKENGPHKYWVKVDNRGVGKSIAGKTGGEYVRSENAVITGPITKEYMQELNRKYGHGIKKYKLQL
ncbi:MAG: hypothetical protein KAS04_00295 [Candidatus Aenigmarchaeota archaeon]|nr:hypothetical protein [Candidatus Aenigmarchaeota archaeon]